MTEVKHTPGPWYFDDSKGPALGGGVVKATIGIWAQHRFDLALAQDDDEIEPEDEKWLCGAWGANKPEDFANARLIAAAPDMLAVLQSLDNLTSQDAAKVVAVVAKAEGRT